VGLNCFGSWSLVKLHDGHATRDLHSVEFAKLSAIQLGKSVAGIIGSGTILYTLNKW
jgi:hypothetical protein